MSAAEQTNGADRSRMSRMPRFSFQIRCSQYANEHVINLPCAEDARQEASQLCCDMIRDIIASLETNPEWRLEVTDESGEPIYLFRFTAKSFKRLDPHKAQSRA
jgi:hypothetical protein